MSNQGRCSSGNTCLVGRSSAARSNSPTWKCVSVGNRVLRRSMLTRTGHKIPSGFFGERQPLSFELRHAHAKQPVSAVRLCCEPRYPEWGLPASRRSDHIRVHRSCRIRAGADATIQLLCRCATDRPAIRRCATRAAVLHDVRSMHVCEGLPSAGFLAVARNPLVIRGSCWPPRLTRSMTSPRGT
jgi:hypothetical protein